MYERGSEWRKWDLHLHTASSYDYEYKADDADEILCKSLQEHNVAAVAITDHFNIDANRIKNLRKLAPNIIFFPGVELRIDKCGANTHVILIFSEKLDLDVLEADFNAIMIREKAKYRDDIHKIFWDYNDVVDFAHKHTAMISIHAGSKSNGIDKITNAIKVAEAIKGDIATKVDIFEIGKKENINDYEQNAFKYIGRKPLILCSDSHHPKNYNIKDCLWIKADLTFEGLRQACIQPQERIFIGDCPPHLANTITTPFHYLDSIIIKQKNESLSPKWFDTELAINSGLTAVIGNKGSGKSALTDIISMVGGAKSINDASFLNKERFRSEKKHYANNYFAQLKWKDGRIINANSLNEDIVSPEYIEYLPQSKIERICNELNDDFQEQIDSVIFSYISDDVKNGYGSLKELLADKYRLIDSKIETIKSAISQVIDNIVLLNNKRTSEYKSKISNDLKYDNELLASHITTQPTAVAKVETDPNAEKLETCNRNIADLQAQIQETNSIFQNVDQHRLAIIDFIEEYNNVENEFKQRVSQIIAKFEVSNIDKSKLKFNVKLDISHLEKLLKNDEEQLNKLSSTVKELKNKLGIIEKQKNELMASASSKEQEYQQYLVDYNKWETRKAEIETNIETTKSELHYIENELESDREKTIKELLSQIQKIFELFQEKVKINDQIYSPVGKELNTFLSKLDDKIDFVTSISLESNFPNSLLRFVNQKIKSPFMGVEQGQAYIKGKIKATDFNNKDSALEFIADLITAIDSEDYKDTMSKILNSSKDYLEYLASMSYLHVNFVLKMGDVDLSLLSPGQRGSVLLVFYLALSKDKKPLIIDQPEDNLDNQSIFNKLVPCILEAKKKRQIIIVTHNPNLAVACDAEQIIYCSLSDGDCKITYETGSIENPVMKQHIIDVLEGTKPAFSLRQNKYNI